mmetsp:Transcript_2113/g.4023  ORF Transcript_2113/g.4023 Transcript_2113/m.4023 type:complete len:216 (-) Transcript_2113:915-1562(-)
MSFGFRIEYVLRISSTRDSPSKPDMNAVSIGPSTTTCATWIPIGPSSRAMAWDNARVACFAPEKAAKPSFPRILAVAPVKIIVPRCRGFIALATSRPVKKAENAAISQTLRYTRAVVSAIPNRTFAPMLCTAISIGPISLSIRLIKSTTSDSCLASQPNATACPPLLCISSTSFVRLSFFLRTTHTVYRSRANLRATAAPVASPAPTTKHTLTLS